MRRQDGVRLGYVLATRHAGERPETADGRLLVDVDLSILGADADRFDEYERQVREEYAYVDDEAFRRGRRLVLEGFVGRASIYGTDATFGTGSKPEERAENLRRSLARLSG